MVKMYVFAALALVAVGVTMGILVMICLGIKRDDRPGGFRLTPMTGQPAPPGRAV
jgi:hypothetical protein